MHTHTHQISRYDAQCDGDHTHTQTQKKTNILIFVLIESKCCCCCFFLSFLWNSKHLPVLSIKFMPKPLNECVECESIRTKEKNNDWSEWVNERTERERCDWRQRLRCSSILISMLLFEIVFADWHETKCDMIGFSFLRCILINAQIKKLSVDNANTFCFDIFFSPSIMCYFQRCPFSVTFFFLILAATTTATLWKIVYVNILKASWIPNSK